MPAMRNRLIATWQRLTGSLWFIPTLIVIAAAALAIGLIEAQPFVDRDVLKRFPRLFGAGAESSRSMLAAIAGSMITVAGVTFSITVVAVSQASSQYTPRILRNFMRDRQSQVVLGVFVGTFVYCLVVVRTIRADEELRFIPSLAVLVAYVLAVVGMGFFVYFVHHIAGSLEAGSILGRVSRETVATVDRLFPEELGDEPPAPKIAEPSAWHEVAARSTGYIQNVDADGLMGLAREHDVVIRMDRGIGDFVAQGTPLASFSRRMPEEVGAALNALYATSDFRTVFQDAEFGIRQMVDIALKALSPGVNDSTTAITSIDHIGAVLVRLSNRRVESPHRVDDEGTLRVIARGPTYERLLKTATDEIRRNAASNVSVLARMLNALNEVAARTAGAQRRALIRIQADLILATAARGNLLDADLVEVKERHAGLLKTLDSAPAVVEGVGR